MASVDAAVAAVETTVIAGFAANAAGFTAVTSAVVASAATTQSTLLRLETSLNIFYAQSSTTFVRSPVGATLAMAIGGSDGIVVRVLSDHGTKLEFATSYSFRDLTYGVDFTATFTQVVPDATRLHALNGEALNVRYTGGGGSLCALFNA